MTYFRFFSVEAHVKVDAKVEREYQSVTGKIERVTIPIERTFTSYYTNRLVLASDVFE